MNNKRIKGYVRWFDDASGEGYITGLENGNTYHLHWSSIPGAKFGSDKTHADFVSIGENQLVSFRPIETSAGYLAGEVKILEDKTQQVRSNILVNLLEWEIQLSEACRYLGLYTIESKLTAPGYRRLLEKIDRLIETGRL